MIVTKRSPQVRVFLSGHKFMFPDLFFRTPMAKKGEITIVLRVDQDNIVHTHHHLFWMMLPRQQDPIPFQKV